MAKRSTRGYLHGYSSTEQRRLIKQAQFLKPWVYPGIDFSKSRNIVEVGSGVGAQTSILLEKFRNLKITCADISPEQLEVAARRLKSPIKKGRVQLVQADATKLPFKNKSFDGAFLCWFLEHVPDPLKILIELRSKLKSGSPVFISEVFNSTLFVEPYSPAILRYWFEFNDYQWTINGHPFVGAQLGNLLKAAGYKKIQTEIRPFLFDSRDPRMRREMIAYWTELLLSAAPGLIASGRVSKRLVSDLKLELRTLAKSSDSLFFYAWYRAVARA